MAPFNPRAPTRAVLSAQIDGFMYERKAIAQWLERNDTSPRTGAKLESKILIPCHAVRNLIRAFNEAC